MLKWIILRLLGFGLLYSLRHPEAPRDSFSISQQDLGIFEHEIRRARALIASLDLQKWPSKRLASPRCAPNGLWSREEQREATSKASQELLEKGLLREADPSELSQASRRLDMLLDSEHGRSSKRLRRPAALLEACDPSFKRCAQLS